MISASVDGGHGAEGGGGGMTPTGGLGPPPPFFFFLKAPEHLFLRQLEISGLLYHLRHGTVSQPTMMHKWHHNPSWKMSSWHWFEDDNGN